MSAKQSRLAHRPPVDRICVEMPAGLIDEGELPFFLPMELLSRTQANHRSRRQVRQLGSPGFEQPVNQLPNSARAQGRSRLRGCQSTRELWHVSSYDFVSFRLALMRGSLG